jgi:hypothetical protein
MIFVYFRDIFDRLNRGRPMRSPDPEKLTDRNVEVFCSPHLEKIRELEALIEHQAAELDALKAPDRLDRINLPDGVLEIHRGRHRIEIKFTANDSVRVIDRCFYDTERGEARIGLEPNLRQPTETVQ